MHERPAHGWSLEELAREASLSRSAFADRFSRLVGQPPMLYITQWRMQIAAGLLARGSKVATVAVDVGYDCEAAFSRAFKRFVGVPPATWRDHAVAPGAESTKKRREAPANTRGPSPASTSIGNKKSRSENSTGSKDAFDRHRSRKPIRARTQRTETSPNRRRRERRKSPRCEHAVSFLAARQSSSAPGRAGMPRRRQGSERRGADAATPRPSLGERGSCRRADSRGGRDARRPARRRFR
ncbi:MAG: helix-turn-helix transcriptional regulator [Planctomycetes bacterium]|nr:helix-turn-helix transcriptional regulator [Planctomycetota bacterium]